MKTLILTIATFISITGFAKTTECRFEDSYLKIDHNDSYSKFKVIDLLSHGLIFEEIVPSTQDTFLRIDVNLKLPITYDTFEATLETVHKTIEFAPGCWDGCDNSIQYPAFEVLKEIKGICNIN